MYINVCIVSAKPVVMFSVTCTASSQYTSCSDALGSTAAQWMSHEDATSAYIRVQMSGQKYVTKLEIKSRCTTNAYNNVKVVDMEFDDGSLQTVSSVSVMGGEALCYI